MKVDPVVQCYDPYIYDGVTGLMTYELKPFEDDPRCLYGWGPPARGCQHRFGHVCVREVRHRGRCWDGIEDDAQRCSRAQRPKDWDSKQRQECNQ